MRRGRLRAALPALGLVVACGGEPIPNVPRPASQVAERASVQREAALRRGVSEPKQILFGDLHVHTTYSIDAALTALSPRGGEGAKPPADACDFARFCSALDFWSINDHAESLSPNQWRETIDSIRACNEVAGATDSPDTVAFLGWEWSQTDLVPETHYGHKNVVLRHTDDARIPTRPIGAVSEYASNLNFAHNAAIAMIRRGEHGYDLARQIIRTEGTPRCPSGVPVRELPADCRELVATPGELFERLDEWGHDAIVIPHGTAWGFYTPPGVSFANQLATHDPNRETLIEMYSGHGNVEEYRDFREREIESDGSGRCPEASPNYLPMCQRAGQIIRERCLSMGFDAAECEVRAKKARKHAVNAGVSPHRVVPGARAEDWLDAGQCRDCFQPAFKLRPMSTAQYLLAMRGFGEASGEGSAADDVTSDRAGVRFRLGFIGSSDNHSARPGASYKELARGRMTDGRGYSEDGQDAVNHLRRMRPPRPVSVPFHPGSAPKAAGLLEVERSGSFMYTAGLVAAHAAARDRDAIWGALERREVYATSGPRILLWFDLLNGDLPMGSSTHLAETPRFRVRAAGSLEQKPGCPSDVRATLGAKRMARLCLDECYHPSDARRLITRIEVVRIRPQIRENEPIGPLVQDPWRVFECARDPAGCTVEFDDPDFAAGQRDALYYARAIEEPSLAINAGGVRCVFDAEGSCTSVDPCGGQKPAGDDCLAETEQRAWSSPIFIDFAPGASDQSAERL